jgi:hypothetical protein
MESDRPQKKARLEQEEVDRMSSSSSSAPSSSAIDGSSSSSSSSSSNSISTFESPALKFEIVARWKKARASILTLPHAQLNTPVFMPVGTQGTVKGLTSSELEELGCGIILGNTYHLGHRPGGDVVETMGGLHRFMNWKRNILTDSGGFQMVSLLKLAEITEVIREDAKKERHNLLTLTLYSCYNLGRSNIPESS